MTAQNERLTYPSADGVHTIHARRWLPQGQPRAVVQIVHGVAEHIGRYDHVARFLQEHGFAVCGEDHLGHGQTAEDGKYGYFAPKGGWELWCGTSAACGSWRGSGIPGCPT